MRRCPVWSLTKLSTVPPVPGDTLGNMAVSLYIVVQGDDPGYDIFVNGRAVARHEDALEKLALKLGVRPLIDFFSADKNAMAVLVEEGAGDSAIMSNLLPPQWFRGEEGLLTVRGLLNELEHEPQQLGSEGTLVVAELREYESVLRKIAMHNGRWHLAVSLR